ncbi:MAG: DUF4339 domain-containing protein [Paenibacillus sp.]|nr:DUF4339 domain-containing protein [Paenibacillus sp.]
MSRIDFEYISEICTKYAAPHFYVDELIPASKLANARQKYPIPEHERVIALIDATMFRSCKSGLAICEFGVIWRDIFSGSERTYLDWEEFAQADIQKLGEYEIEFAPGVKFNASGSKIDVVIELLEELQEYVYGVLHGDYSNVVDFEEEQEDDELAPPPLPDIEWMIAVAGKQYGPYDLGLLRSMVESKQLLPEHTLVWRRGMDEWMWFKEQPEMAALVNGAAASESVPPASTGSSTDNDSLEQLLYNDSKMEDADQIDINSASYEQLLELPFIHAERAAFIVKERAAIGGYRSPEQLGEQLGLKPHQVLRLGEQTLFLPLQSVQGAVRVIDF